jgi:hypothetical protein
MMDLKKQDVKMWTGFNLFRIEYNGDEHQCLIKDGNFLTSLVSINCSRKTQYYSYSTVLW